MYKRLWIVSAVILIALAVLCGLGLYSINTHANGLKAQRQAAFYEVAENIRVDVNRKFNDFIRTEQAVPYTHYQHFYTPVASNEADALLVSPLAKKFENGLAKGYFQIDSKGNITTPYQNPNDKQSHSKQIAVINKVAKEALLPALNVNGFEDSLVKISQDAKGLPDQLFESIVKKDNAPAPQQEVQSRKSSLRSRSYRIDSTQQQKTQVLNQSRKNVDFNFSNNTISQSDEDVLFSINKKLMPESVLKEESAVVSESKDAVNRQMMDPMMMMMDAVYDRDKSRQTQLADDMVQIRIEPFAPVITADSDIPQTLFDGRVFMVRHIQIEDKHFIQGFQLDQNKLNQEIAESASRMLRNYMNFEIAAKESLQASHSAILDFEFGSVILNLFDKFPTAIAQQVSFLRNCFLAIVTVVSAATLFAIISLWRNIASQITLAGKKDDFISAVSHELRTPLTSIRMYTEMLEKGWVKSDAKRSEYYVNMRQESERLTRLIENVLDFSRIQRGKKHYNFKLGDINECVDKVVEMMKPCAEQAGFTIEENLCEDADVMSFDSDAVTQVVINLIDNAVKYAKNTEDKTIMVRTKCDTGYLVIEVEDHGPGIAMGQRKKIFEEFYRIGSESTRQTTGTGLGLALIRKFVEAHNGFIEVLSAKPTGVIFKVALPLS